MITLEHGLCANQTTSQSSKITAGGTQEDSATVLAQEAKKGITFESTKTPAKKPILKIIRKTVTSDQGSGTTNKIPDYSSGEFSNGGPGTGTDEAFPVPAVATTNTMAIENAASKMSTITSELNTQTQVSDTQQDDLLDSDFVFQGITF